MKWQDQKWKYGGRKDTGLGQFAIIVAVSQDHDIVLKILKFEAKFEDPMEEAWKRIVYPFSTYLLLSLFEN